MRTLLYTFIFIFLGLSAQGQIRNLRLGISGEPASISSMDSDTPLIEFTRINLSSSIFFKTEYYFSPFVSFASGVGFTVNQGGSLLYTEGGDVWADAVLVPEDLHTLSGPTIYRTSIQYLEIPVALKLRTDEMGRYRVFFEIPRLTMGITTGASGAIKNDDVSVRDQNIYPAMAPLNLSYGLMAGIEYSLTENISGVLGLNWKQGFVDITKDTAIDSRITSYTFGLHAGILF